MDIIYLLVCIAILLLVMALSYAVYSKILDRALDYFESIIGTKAMGIICLILSIAIMILVVWKVIAS